MSSSGSTASGQANPAPAPKPPIIRQAHRILERFNPLAKRADGPTGPGVEIASSAPQRADERMAKLGGAQKKGVSTRPPIHALAELDQNDPRVVGAQDASAREFLQSLRLDARRSQVSYGAHRVLFSRLPTDNLRTLCESRDALLAIPQVRKLFPPFIGGLIYDPPAAQMRSRLWIGDAPAPAVAALKPLHEKNAQIDGATGGQQEADHATRSARRPSARAYLAVAVEDGHQIYGTKAGSISWEELDHSTLLAGLEELMADLSRLHGQAGLEVGDTTPANLILGRSNRFKFISMGHLTVLNPQTSGLPETLVLLASFSHDLDHAELRTLLHTYLEAEPNAKERAEEYLRHRHRIGRSTRHLPYAPRAALVERLVERVESLVGSMTYHQAHRRAAA